RSKQAPSGRTARRPLLVVRSGLELDDRDRRQALPVARHSRALAIPAEQSNLVTLEPAERARRIEAERERGADSRHTARRDQVTGECARAGRVSAGRTLWRDPYHVGTGRR